MFLSKIVLEINVIPAEAGIYFYREPGFLPPQE